MHNRHMMNKTESKMLQQVTGLTLQEILDDLVGAKFVAIDTLTVLPLNKTLGGRGTGANPHFGRVLKRSEGCSVMVYSNTKSNAYENMVKRRLANNGQDPEKFELQARKWGERVANTCFIKHTKDGVEKTYMEVIFLRGPKKVEYLLNGKPIDKGDIMGFKEPTVSPQAQGGLGGTEDEVILRTFECNSIKRIRTDKKEYIL
jgi:hypothetical protein